MIILGIDPGLNATGYGFIDAQAGRCTLITAGDIRPPRRLLFQERIAQIHRSLTTLVQLHRPHTAVLEKIFTHQRFPTAASLMAHARGVACLVAQEQNLVLAEYLPTRIKRALTGRGHANKDQVSRMVQHWLGTLDPSWSSDATDALALAIAHAHMETSNAVFLAAR